MPLATDNVGNGPYLKQIIMADLAGLACLVPQVEFAWTSLNEKSI